MSDVIACAIELIKKRFDGDSSGHDFYHTIRVYNLATHIAKYETADLKIVQLSALLHDVDDTKLFQSDTELECARGFMEELNINPLEMEEVCQIIREISFKGVDSVKPSSIEGMIVQDADRLDAIGAIGIARTFAYGGSRGRMLHHPDINPNLNMGADEYYNHVGTSINHFYEKLLKLKELMNTVEGKRIAENRHRYMLRFLEEFHSEWEGNL